MNVKALYLILIKNFTQEINSLSQIKKALEIEPFCYDLKFYAFLNKPLPNKKAPIATAPPNKPPTMLPAIFAPFDFFV